MVVAKSDRIPSTFLAAIAAAVLSTALPIAAAAREPGLLPVQWDGRNYGGGGYHSDWHPDGDESRHERWISFYHARMHEHFEREGSEWASLPNWQKERVIHEEWERWGERRWERPG